MTLLGSFSGVVEEKKSEERIEGKEWEQKIWTILLRIFAIK